MTDSAAPPDPPPAPARGGSGLVGGAVLIAAVTVAARLAGFGRVVVFARTVGPTCLGDVYTTANTVPNIVFDIVAGGALSSLVVPLLAGRFAANDPARAADAGREARQIVGGLLSWMLLLLVPVAVAGGLLAHPLMSLLVGSGSGRCDRAAEVALGARMLAVFAPQIVLYGVGIVLAGVLQARRRFLGPALAPLLSSLVVIATYLGFRVLTSRVTLSTHLHADTWLLAGGTTVGVLALSLPLAWPAVRGWGVRPTLRFPPGVAAAVRRLAVSGAVVIASQDLATAVVLRLANSRGIAGSVVVYNLTWTVFQLPWAILAVPIATSSFPALAAAWDQRRLPVYDEVLAGATRGILVLVTVAAAALIAVAPPAARVLVAGAPGVVDPGVLARSLVALAPGVVGYGLVALWSRARYAAADVWLPATAAAVGWLVAIVVDVLTAWRLSAASVTTGLAAGIAVGVTTTGALLAVPVLRRLNDQRRTLARTGAVAAVAAGLGGVAGRAACNALPVTGPAGSLGETVAGGLACLVVAAGMIAVLDRQLLLLPLARRGGGRRG